MLNPSIWIGLLALVVLEIVLGIDNLVFIAILTENLPIKQRDKARLIGLSLALIIRIFLIFFIYWLMTLNNYLWKSENFDFSIRNVILLIGGVFLTFKAIIELYRRAKDRGKTISSSKTYSNFWVIITQIVFLDIVFSLDAIITAVGIINNLFLIIIAVIISNIIMFFASKPLVSYLNLYPNIAIICLSFLLIIGLSLIAESFNFSVPKSYLYSIMVF
ncbi:TerC family protein [Candidatus Pantoea edessiphila]|nr:TerC family protein [Candidatus Pantoea edessiphila]